MEGENNDKQRGSEFDVAAWLIIILLGATTICALILFPFVFENVSVEMAMLVGLIVGYLAGRAMN